MDVLARDGRPFMLGLREMAAIPDPGIAVPEPTIVGNASLSNLDYLQSVILPTPPAGTTWCGGVQGGRFVMLEPGSHDLAVGRVNQPQRALVLFLVDLATGAVSEQRAHQPIRGGQAPLEIVGSVSLLTTGRVHDPLNVVWPTIANPGDWGETKVLRIYTSLTAAPVATIAAGDIPSTVQDHPTWALGRQMKAALIVDDPARGPIEFESAPVTITAAEDMRALTAADIELGASVYRPQDQTTTFTPTFSVPGLTQPFEMQFRASPLDADDPWSPVAAGAAGGFRLPDVIHPDFPGFNAAVFREGEARNSRLRFRWRRSPAHPWSTDSTLFTVPVPVPPAQQLRSLTSGDLVMGESVYRPTGQTATYSPTFTVPGLGGSAFEMEFRASPLDWTGEDPWSPVAPLPGQPGVYHLPDVSHPSFPGFNAALFRASETARNERLRFRWRPDGAEQWSPDSALFAVPLPAGAPPVVAPPAPESLQAAMLPSLVGRDNARSAPLTNYRHGGINGRTDGGENIPVYTNLLYAHHAPVIVALGAFGGDPACRTRLVQQLNHWCGSSSTNNAPRAVNGYCGQYEGDFVATCLIAVAIPGLYDELAAATRTRLDLCMIAIGIAAMYIGSDTFTGTRGWTNEANIRGFSSNRNGVLNFKAPPRMLPHAVDRYMVLRGLGRLNTYVQSFNRTTFANQLNAAGGLRGAYDTFRQTWTLAVQNAAYPNGHSAFGVGPTEAQLLTSIRGSGGVYRCFGFTLDQTVAVFQEVVSDAFSADITPGLVNRTGGETAPSGSGWPSGTRYGLKDGATGNALYACMGTNGGGGKGSWAGIPNKGLKGRMRELDTTDGGKSGVAWNNRSSIPYALHGTQFCCNMLASMICAGAFTPTPGVWGGADGAVSRIARGMVDLEYIRVHGWWSIDKGETKGIQGPTWFANNGTFTPALTSLAGVFSSWLALA